MSGAGDPGKRNTVLIVVVAGFVLAAIAGLLGAFNGGEGEAGAEGPAAPPSSDPLLVPTGANSTSGSSNAALQLFAAAPGWRLTYSFTCSDGSSGFDVYTDQSDSTSLIDIGGTSGSGVVAGDNAVGPIDLGISTSCAWTMALEP